MLGHTCVGASDDHAVVGHVSERGPDLLAVDHPGVTVALGLGLQAGDVGAGAGLGEHLAPDFLAGDVVGEVGGLLLVGAVLGEHREAHAVADRELERHVRVVAVFLAPDALVFLGEALAAVLLRVGEAGETGFGQRLLEDLAVLESFGAAGIGVAAHVHAGGVLVEERTATSAEFVDLGWGHGVGHGHSGWLSKK